jgi:3-deoxy-D-manno-octulosonic-acid transferase
LIYDLALFIYFILSLPKICWDRLRGKKHPAFLQRLGFFLPIPTKPQVIWIHAVSVGEVKAAVPFFDLLKEKFPKSWIVITTTTATGQLQAKRSLSLADAFLYLPFDFSFSSRLFVKAIRPDLFFLVESDFWPNLLKNVKRRGGKTFLVSGKISSRSVSRWQKFPFLAKRFFSSLDLLCVQNKEHANRFLSLVQEDNKIKITGNLKFDMRREFLKPLPFVETRSYITLSCTHAPEEDLLLDRLLTMSWTILLAPRHPERFREVQSLLERKKITYTRLSDYQEKSGLKVILIDSMGLLPSCYTRSFVAIVGGSFIPGVGGHNVLEPCFYGCPSIFGPYTYGQIEIVQTVLKGNSGLESPLEGILETVEKISSDRVAFSRRAEELVGGLHGISLSTWKEISSCI